MDQKEKVPVLLLLLLLGICKAQECIGQGNGGVIPVETNPKEDMTTTILRMNEGSGESFFEGDVIMPTSRNAMKCLKKPHSCLWPRRKGEENVVVPYVLNERYDNTERREILRAMKDLESKTCIRYIPRTTQRAYITVEPRFGCSSLLGYVGARQVVSLQRYGCVSFGIIQHELLHALGFYHEHTRSDRDKYIRINWDNVKQYYRINFELKDTNNLGTSYDYSSVMHYGKTAFGVNRSETITPIPNPNVPIGQRERLSPTDVLRINRLYKCRK